MGAEPTLVDLVLAAAGVGVVFLSVALGGVAWLRRRPGPVRRYRPDFEGAGLALTLLGGGGVLLAMGLADWRPVREADRYVVAPGRVRTSEVRREASDSQFEVLLQYDYSVDGFAYEGDRYDPSGDPPEFDEESEARDFAERFAAGTRIDVLHDRADPRRSVLAHGSAFWALVMLLAGVAVAGLAGVIFVRLGWPRPAETPAPGAPTGRKAKSKAKPKPNETPRFCANCGSAVTESAAEGTVRCPYCDALVAEPSPEDRERLERRRAESAKAAEADEQRRRTRSYVVWGAAYAGVLGLCGLGMLLYFISTEPAGLFGRRGSPPPRRVADELLAPGVAGEVLFPVDSEATGFQARFGIDLPQAGPYFVAASGEAVHRCAVRAVDAEGVELAWPEETTSDLYLPELPAGRVYLAFGCDRDAGGRRLGVLVAPSATVTPGAPVVVPLPSGAEHAAARLEIQAAGRYSVVVRSPAGLTFAVDPGTLSSYEVPVGFDEPGVLDPPIPLEAGRHVVTFRRYGVENPIRVEVQVLRVE